MRSEEKKKIALRSGLPRREHDSQLPESGEKPLPLFRFANAFWRGVFFGFAPLGSWVVTVPPAQGRR